MSHGRRRHRCARRHPIFALTLAAQGGAELISDVYALLPGDLRTLPTDLGPKLFEPTPDRPALLRPDLPTLILAECVFIYLAPEQSSALLRWSATTFREAAVALYDPAALDDSFGRIMVTNLRVCARWCS